MIFPWCSLSIPGIDHSFRRAFKKVKKVLLVLDLHFRGNYGFLVLYLERFYLLHRKRNPTRGNYGLLFG